MPTSSLVLAPHVVHLVHLAEPHRRVLDVGPGFGKYGLLLREYLNQPPQVIDAVEVEASYVTPRLQAIYDRVIVGDVLDLSDEALAGYDVVLMADVLEHLELDHGAALLARIPGWVVVSTPDTFFHNGDGLPDSETHRSLWSRADIEAVRPVAEDASRLGAVLVSLSPRG